MSSNNSTTSIMSKAKDKSGMIPTTDRLNKQIRPPNVPTT